MKRFTPLLPAALAGAPGFAANSPSKELAEQVGFKEYLLQEILTGHTGAAVGLAISPKGR
jgi:hypothetical protein